MKINYSIAGIGIRPENLRVGFLILCMRDSVFPAGHHLGQNQFTKGKTYVITQISKEYPEYKGQPYFQFINDIGKRVRIKFNSKHSFRLYC